MVTLQKPLYLLSFQPLQLRQLMLVGRIIVLRREGHFVQPFISSTRSSIASSVLLQPTECSTTDGTYPDVLLVHPVTDEEHVHIVRGTRSRRPNTNSGKYKDRNGYPNGDPARPAHNCSTLPSWLETPTGVCVQSTTCWIVFCFCGRRRLMNEKHEDSLTWTANTQVKKWVTCYCFPCCGGSYCGCHQC